MRGDGEIDRRHHLIAHLYDRHSRSRAMQVLGHFQSDKSRAHDDSAGDRSCSYIVFDTVRIVDVSQSENSFAVDALQRRTHRRSARRQEQLVVAFRIGRSIRTAHFDALCRGIDAYRLVFDPHVDIESSAERSRGL